MTTQTRQTQDIPLVLLADPGAARPEQEGRAHFEIYRSDQVHFTSMLMGGGDWHWRLVDESGTVIADCGGHKSRRDCLGVVRGIRKHAGRATVPDYAQLS